jgi:hypothetical protein
VTSDEDLRRVQGILESLSDDALRRIVDDERSRGAWGWSGTGNVDGTTVFVKRIPVTDVEVAAWPSTRNHFDLPMAYQYGVGSAGFGAAREEHVHRTVTEWVVEGRTDAFPVLHHARLLLRDDEPWQIPRDRNEYLAMWGGDPAIAAFMDARTAATHDLWLVAEHLPHTLADWLIDHQDRVDDVLDGVFDAAALLRENGIAHLDAHFANIVLDAGGERFCLSDFGLALSAAAELDADERAFLAAHRHYDVGEMVFSLSGLLGGVYRRLSDEERDRVLAVCGLARGAPRLAVGAALVSNARRLGDEEVLALHPRYVAALERFQPVIDHMVGFYSGLTGDLTARPSFYDAALVMLLADSGVDVGA